MSSDRRNRSGTAALLAASLALSPSAADGQTPRSVPLCPGLTLVTAVNGPEGDYESIKTIASADARGIAVTYSAQVPTKNGSLRNWNMRRVMLREDLGAATFYAHYFHSNGSDTIPGSTTLGVSTAVLRSLKRTGTAEITLVEGGNYGFPADRSKAPNLYDYEETWKLRRVGTEPVRVTVNDSMVALPAVHARGSYLGAQVDFWFLDDEENPLTLAYGFASGGDALSEAWNLRTVKIAWHCTGSSRTASEERILRLERALREQHRAVVYDLFFDFNSERIRPESEPTLRDIAEVLRRNPDWTLSIEGHTDNVASERYNLELSGRRAAAVKAALATRLRIAGTRLSTAGFGEASPRDRNDTLEGRARNRRVELVRR
ncbi:MAG TPA: OmpA family protein [Gemmatimonadales bacterium]|nr:OmpA family protein [Gemmatimonadales bacterium]